MRLEEMEQRLIFEEGLRLRKYRCSEGFETIGVGRNLESNPYTAEELSNIKDPDNLTEDEAMMLLDNDIFKCVKKLNKLNAYLYADKQRRYALLSMCFQMGFEGLCKFKKMLLAMDDKDYDKASIECLDSSYAKQTPARANRIAHLIKTGKWVV